MPQGILHSNQYVPLAELICPGRFHWIADQAHSSCPAQENREFSSLVALWYHGWEPTLPGCHTFGNDCRSIARTIRPSPF